MRDGQIQQADTPQRLFESPVNLFVAGFIGSPAMNFAGAALERDDGPCVRFAGLRLPVTVSVTEKLGTEIHAIFPIDAPPVEHALVASAAAGNTEEDETVTALAGGRSWWTARVSSRSAVCSGQPLELAVGTGALHFFDPDSGETIGGGQL